MALVRPSPRVLTRLVAGCALLLAMLPWGTSARSTAAVVSINYAHWGDIYEIRGTQALITAFNKSHPSIKVHLQAADWSTYWTKLPTQMAAGQAPDAFFFDEGYYQTHYVRTGPLLD